MAASMTDSAWPTFIAPPLSSPSTVNSWLAAFSISSALTSSQDLPVSRLPKPNAARPAKPTGRLASFALRAARPRLISATRPSSMTVLTTPHRSGNNRCQGQRWSWVCVGFFGPISGDPSTPTTADASVPPTPRGRTGCGRTRGASRHPTPARGSPDSQGLILDVAALPFNWSLQDSLDVAFGERSDGHKGVATKVAGNQRRIVDIQLVVPLDPSVTVGRVAPNTPTHRMNRVGCEDFSLEDVVAIVHAIDMSHLVEHRLRSRAQMLGILVRPADADRVGTLVVGDIGTITKFTVR